MKSIIQNRKECFFCKTTQNLHLHHIYFGVKNRTASDKNGFTCYLCQQHHEGTYGVHGKYGHKADLYLKQYCQEVFERTHSREEFIKLIGKNYIGEVWNLDSE